MTKLEILPFEKYVILWVYSNSHLMTGISMTLVAARKFLAVAVITHFKVSLMKSADWKCCINKKVKM